MAYFVLLCEILFSARDVVNQRRQNAHLLCSRDSAIVFADHKRLIGSGSENTDKVYYLHLSDPIRKISLLKGKLQYIFYCRK